MVKHLRVCLWAFTVLWKLKTIKGLDRLGLWVKSMNLYYCFLGFADEHPPWEQVYGAMLGAVLSAVYDYDTDWRAASSYERSHLHALLERYVPSENARHVAGSLFQTDLAGELSREGLERGGPALVFYDLLIRSNRFSAYSPEEIDNFGKYLQIVDDLLDFTEDERNRHKNCLIGPRRDFFLAEGETFLASGFYEELVRQAKIYELIRIKCLARINELRGNVAPRKELLNSVRPRTGAFAAVLTLAGFRLYDAPWLIAVLATCAFTGITWSIMVTNDLIDRQNDVRKGKTLAREHTWEMVVMWVKLSMLINVFLAGVLLLHAGVGILCLFVWVIGILYSFTRRMQVVNNLIVASCSASPVLCGAVYAGKLEERTVIIFVCIFIAIFMREIVRDIADVPSDPGYKRTIPLSIGHMPAVMLLVTGCFVLSVSVMFYPSWPVRASAVILAPSAATFGLMLLHPERQPLAIRHFDYFLTVFLLIVFFIN